MTKATDIVVLSQNASGTAPLYAARAWVNFNGTGTVAIRASGNVTSITDNGVGNYTINLTTAMPDANYAITGVAGNGGSATAYDLNSYNSGANTASAVNVISYVTTTGTGTDAPYVAVAIFR